MSMSHLFVGSVEWADPTLLISGDEQSLSWLAERIELRQIARLRPGHPEFFVSEQTMTLIPTQGAGRLREQRGHYEWRIGAKQARGFAERLRALANSTQPAHAYLDTDSLLQIVASKGEYDLQRLASMVARQ